MPRGNSFSPVDGWHMVRLLKLAGWESRNASSHHVVLSKAGQRQIIIRPTAPTREAQVAVERALGVKLVGGGLPKRSVQDKIVDDLVALGGGGARFERRKAVMPELTVRSEDEVGTPEEFKHGASKPDGLDPRDQAVVDSYKPENRVAKNYRHEPVSLANDSDQAALVRLAKRRLERLDVEFQQVQIRYEQLKEQHTATVLFLESLGVNTDIETAPLATALADKWVDAPKRTVLPPTGPRVKRAYLRQSDKDKIKMAFVDAGSPSGYGWVKKVQDKLANMGVKEIPDHVIGAKSWAK